MMLGTIVIDGTWEVIVKIVCVAAMIDIALNLFVGLPMLINPILDKLIARRAKKEHEQFVSTLMKRKEKKDDE